MDSLKIPQMGSGMRFHSNNEAFLQGMRRGMAFVNDEDLTDHGIFSSTSDAHKFMLMIECEDDDEVFDEYL
jgi:hypothetical protein